MARHRVVYAGRAMRAPRWVGGTLNVTSWSANSCFVNYLARRPTRLLVCDSIS